MPFEPTAGPELNSVGLVSLVTLKVSDWSASSGGPAEMAVAHPVMLWAPASSSFVWFAPLVKLGASFTAVMLTWKVCGALLLGGDPLSTAVTVTSAVPFALAAGVNVRSPLPFRAGWLAHREEAVAVVRHDE